MIMYPRIADVCRGEVVSRGDVPNGESFGADGVDLELNRREHEPTKDAKDDNTCLLVRTADGIVLV
jgi:hypothetical protein